MKKGILGKKIGMTQIFTDNGSVIPVTVVEAGPCVIVQKKIEDKDGYNSLQLGFMDKKLKVKKNSKGREKYNIVKPLKGHFEKNKLSYKRYLREFKFENLDKYNVGDEITADIFKQGDIIDVTGISKGKGFAGVIKRWNHSRGPMAHGSRYHRRPGSMGAGSSPARVFKGKKLAGHMGAEKVTVQNLEIIKVDADKNIMLIKGGVPGIRGSMLIIKEAIKQA